jgi:hypothetical protein
MLYTLFLIYAIPHLQTVCDTMRRMMRKSDSGVDSVTHLFASLCRRRSATAAGVSAAVPAAGTSFNDVICAEKFQGWCRDTLSVDLTISETHTVLDYIDLDQVCVLSSTMRLDPVALCSV